MRQPALPNRLVALALLLASPTCAAAAAWHVDADVCPGPGSGSAADPFCRIQDAIDATVDYDEVQVAPGDYDGPLDLRGRRIHLRSAEGPAVTTLRNEAGSVISCVNGETEETIVEGFTITRGPGTFAVNCTGNGHQEGYFGGGIYVVNGGLTVRSCVFIENGNVTGDAIVGGASIYGQYSKLDVSDSVFLRNGITGTGTLYGNVTECGPGHVTVTDSQFDFNGRGGTFGGGVFGYRGGLTVERCRFFRNTASFGAGIMATPNQEHDPTAIALIRDCEFIDNIASHGGAIFAAANNGAHVEVKDCDFDGNSALGGGGGALLIASNGTAEMARCRFDFNRSMWGGGLELNSSIDAEIKVHDLLLFDNHALQQTPDGVGGGISATASQDATLEIANVTTIDNTAWYSGGGIHKITSEGGVIHTANVIARDNLPNQIVGPGNVVHSNVEDGLAGAGNIDADPRFRDPLSRDYRLDADSPCIDSGHDPSVLDFASDLDGAPRVVYGNGPPGARYLVDMGSFEFPNGSLLRFREDGVTLVWPEIGGAVFYNLYRGPLGPWIDGNGDGLPDQGYGQCANDLDPDTTDTVFVDETVPESGSGYTYMMSMIDSEDAEHHLGTTSAGVARQVDPSCP